MLKSIKSLWEFIVVVCKFSYMEWDMLNSTKKENL